MATGQVFQLIPQPPGTLAAQQDIRAGGSTPAESVPVFDFDDTTVEYMDFYGVAEGYDGGGFTLTIKWSAETATTLEVVWSAAFRRLADDLEDVDTSHSYDYNNATAATAPSVSGEVDYVTLTFTDGADSDSVADGEAFILRVRRFASDAGDDMSGDAELWWPALHLRET